MASDSIASIVERATSELLMMPDWDANMALVDAATADTSGGVYGSRFLAQMLYIHALFHESRAMYC
jgi:hypothetical protein